MKIVCAEPRRISAISLAQRVSAEMGDRGGPGSGGSLVGYSIRGESKVASTTRLTFATTVRCPSLLELTSQGVVLRMLESDEAFAGVTHIILDEVVRAGSKTSWRVASIACRRGRYDQRLA